MGNSGAKNLFSFPHSKLIHAAHMLTASSYVHALHINHFHRKVNFKDQQWEL